ncbi:hypothetical protein GTQ40_10545 [Flavobacteriaceae bacterium R38]|nr:hypothetical protein [Flavobacteriaceae bacterium R38]
MKLFKFFEILYLVVAVLSVIEVVTEWGANRNRAYMFLIFAVGAIIMFFFRRHYRKKFEARKKEQ